MATKNTDVRKEETMTVQEVEFGGLCRIIEYHRTRALADRLLVQERCARAYTDAVFQTLDHAYRSMSENKEQIEITLKGPPKVVRNMAKIVEKQTSSFDNIGL